MDISLKCVSGKCLFKHFLDANTRVKYLHSLGTAFRDALSNFWTSEPFNIHVIFQRYLCKSVSMLTQSLIYLYFSGCFQGYLRPTVKTETWEVDSLQPPNDTVLIVTKGDG